MKKTITQRFFLSLCLMIVGCLGGAVWAETVTYTITSSSAVSTSGTAPTGSSATFKNTYTTKDQLIGGKTMTLTLSGYAGKSISGITLSMKSNKTAGSGYLSVTAGETPLATIGSSSNGIAFEDGLWNGKYTNTYTDVKPSMSNSSYIIQNGENVVIVIGATINSLYCESFTLTYEDHTPALTVSSNSISFGYVETKSSGSTQSFTLSGKNLTPNSEATLTLDDETHFSVSRNTVNVNADGKIVSTDIEVAYVPTTIGQHSATLTISSGTISEIISLTGRGVDSETNYTISWMVNGNSYTKGEPTTKVAAGYQVATLPTNPAAIGSKVFMGWTASTISGTSDDAPADLFTTAENAPDVTSNTTYYAVFASATAGDSYWEEIKTAPEAGKYAILSDSYFMSSTITSSRFKNGPKPQISSTTPATLTTAPAEDCIWEITKPDSYYRIANGGQYAGGTTSKNQGAMLSNESNNFAKWTIEYSGTQFNVVNYGRSLQASDSDKKYLRNNDNYGWACYASSTGKAPRLFKETTPYTYSDYATTVATLADRNLSFGETTAFDVYDNTFVAPTLTGQTSDVTYTSSNTSVATVDEYGTITLAGGFGTTTITASAAEDEVNGYLAGEASYTLSVWPNSIAGIKTMITSTTAVDFKAELTDATITYVNDRNVYLQDANAAILMFLDSEHGLTAGKSYTGKVSGTATLFSGLREITSIDLSGITPTDNTIEPEVVTLAALNADYDKYESMYVKVAGVTTGTFTTSDPVQTTTLTQDEATLAFAAPSTITLVENNDYDFVGFLGMYNSTPQFKIYEESQATNQGKFAAGLAFEQASYTVEVNNIITVKATNASDAAITYSVDDEVHAAVDENGEFMADAAGTYTITATCPATETHIAGTATCQVTVTMPASNIHATTYYKKITSTDELVDGGQYVIVYAADKKGLLAGESNVNDQTPATVVFDDNGTITTANAAAMTEITFEKEMASTYYLNINNSKYIKATSSTTRTLSVATGKDKNALWFIDFDASGNVEITSMEYSNRGIMYSTDNRFKNYAISNRGDSDYPAIQLYQKVGEMPIAAVTGGITTYVADFAYSMPQHLVGHTVILAYEKDEILTEKPFRAGDEVPALTPLLIKSTEDYAAEETSKTYYPAVLNKAVAAYDGNNMLEYRRDASNITKSMKTGSVYYYKLAIKDGNVGFYWGAEGGAAFKMTKPSTAYLTVPQSSSVQGFVLNLEEGEPTGIATVTTDENAPIYNLQGIRMNGKNLPKGIYIQGGKKFMVK